MALALTRAPQRYETHAAGTQMVLTQVDRQNDSSNKVPFPSDAADRIGAVHRALAKRGNLSERNTADCSDIEYGNTGDLVEDAKHIIDSARRSAHQAVNVALVVRNWLLGGRIAEEELGDATRSNKSR